MVDEQASEPMGEEVPADKSMAPETLIQAAIDRVRDLNDELPCRENLQALVHLQQSLGWQEARTAERNTQGVKGSDLPHDGPHDFICSTCGARVEIHVHGA